MKRALAWFIKFYQRAVSPFLQRSCRFTPSCSSYFLEAVEKRGIIKGSLLGLKRICRCHPLCPGGFDPLK